MKEQHDEHKRKMSYGKFTVMMLISFIIMYAGMFTNMDKLVHYHTSATRLYMTILMVAPMAIVMIAMMGKMYASKKINSAIVIMSVVVFALALAGLRTQTPVGDVQYMRAMIPHHSSAIMTSKHASIKDPELRELADSIIASQVREIAQMERILDRMGK